MTAITPAAFLNARFVRAARAADAAAAGYFRLAAAVLNDDAERLSLLGASLTPRRIPRLLANNRLAPYPPDMAKKFIEYVIDDLDGTELPPGDGGTVRFGFAGRAYEIDLSTANAATLEQFLQPYIRAARPDSGGPVKPGPKKPHRSADDARNTAIRAWAESQGIEMPTRGRIPADVAKAYDAANKA